ncbi:MAG: AAA family ATPase [bacterium]|nr:AAA family ATPase [bacterium]
MRILEYKIIEKIDETDNSIVFRGEKKKDEGTVIIKVLKTGYSSLSEIARFKQEYRLIKSLDIDGIVKTYSIADYENGIAIILEDFNAISLKSYIKHNRISMQTFLEVGITLAEILGKLHERNIIHKDIKPDNILINVETGTVKLTDFGIATVLTHENEKIYNPEVMDGTLLYMSPEQTGRMNRAVDYRTDLYSLGIAFYEMLTTVVPFRSNDPMEIIHFHIARKPVPPVEYDDTIPEVVSEIVMKLLSKRAEERYQNSFGLAADLRRCLEQLEDTGFIENFPLGHKDISIKFNIPRKLFGREEEMRQLLRIFEQAANPPESLEQVIGQIMLVSGPPGIGKSALILETRKMIVENRGYFISGKYEQYGKEVPYSSIIQAFQALVKELLSESNKRINIWKELLLETLGTNGKVITDVIPEMEFILGKQSPVVELGPEESRNRFSLVFKKFIGIFAKQDHPVVMFLDDLQWIDSASLKLVYDLMTVPYLFFVGSYRDSEVVDSHSLLTAIEEMKRSGMTIHSMKLGSLTIYDVNSLVSEFLRCDKERSFPLAEIIHKKTGGNPFFVNQFLQTLYEEEILVIDPSRGWQWDMDRVNQVQVTDNVVDLMAGRISKLHESTREILKTCACFGNRFDLETLSVILEKPVEEILLNLTEAVEEGFVSILDNIYIFQHDRIQEAAYSLIPEEERSQVHYRIGKYILDRSDEAVIENRIFYVVNQLNFGIKFISDPAELERLKQLNLTAGKKAKKSTAYMSAYKFFETALQLLPENNWKNDYQTTIEIYMQLAECRHLNHDYADAEEIFALLIANARTAEDKAMVYSLRMVMTTTLGKHNEVVAIGVEGLRLLGIKIPANPGNLSVLKAMITLKLMLLNKNIDDLHEMREISNSKQILVMSLLVNIFLSAYLTSPYLAIYISLRMLVFTLKHGISKMSVMAYASYGFFQILFGNYPKAVKFVDLAFEVEKRLHATTYKSKIYFVKALVSPWGVHYREAIKYTNMGLRHSLENGDQNYAIYNIQGLILVMVNVGDPLNSISEVCKNYFDFIARSKDPGALNFLISSQQYVKCLQGNTKEKYSFDDEGFSEASHLEKILYDDIPIIKQRHYLLKARALYIMGDYMGASVALEETGKLQEYLKGSFEIMDYVFFNSLNAAMRADLDSPREKRKTVRVLNKDLKLLKKWNKNCPMNMEHKYLLVQAEKARIQGNVKKAMNCYDSAIASANKHEYVQNEAIANELAGRFYLSLGMERVAGVYIREAMLCFEHWGAMGKVLDLSETYPRLTSLYGSEGHSGKSTVSGTGTSSRTRGQTIGGTGSGTIATSTEKRSEILDLSSVMKASEALAMGIDLDRVLEKLMSIAIENAGAERGALILQSEDGLILEALGDVNADEIIQLRSVPVEKSDDVSLSVVHYVERTRKVIILDDASTDKTFLTDPYILKNKPKSVLCGPVMIQKELIGIIYLENNLTTGVFTRFRVDVLNILLAQAAISIENARLAEKEKERATLQKEIDMAREILLTLLPTKIPKIEKARVAFQYEPMMGVGGDFLDINYMDGKQKLGLFICDVSGHGVPAAFVASMTKMALHSWDTYIETPARALEVIREPLIKNIGENFITACICSLDLNTGELVFASAGHVPLAVLRKGRTVELFQTEGRMIYNLFEPNYSEKRIQLNPGDKLILYTDGITEALSPGNVMLGADDDDKFRDWLRRNTDPSRSPVEICQSIYDGVIEYTGNENFADDFTVLVTEYNG